MICVKKYFAFLEGFYFQRGDMIRWSLSLLVICFSLSMAGCGKKGEIRYPETFAPRAVDELTAVRSGERVLLTWKAPRLTRDGDDLGDLSYFLVRRVEVRRFVADRDFLDVGRVEVDTAKEKQEGPLEYSFTDSKVPLSSRYLYAVIPVNADDVEGSPARTRVEDARTDARLKGQVIPGEKK